MLRSFSTLYSLNSNGSVQQWDISVKGSIIVKKYGRVGGKVQTTQDIIKGGKNKGHSNETTAEEQALAEAKSQWEKKLKSGYTKTQAEAKKGIVDSTFVTGGIDPMLAHKFRDHEAKIVYPAFSQPKLDGIRCIAIVKEGKATLWSRTRKPITGVPHIIKALEETFFEDSIILDGELYNHSYKDKFEEIVSFVKQVTPKEGHEVVQYCIYDMVEDAMFSDRLAILKRLRLVKPLVLVPTYNIKDVSSLMEHFESDREAGYEGTMVRNGDTGVYEHKRSYHLQKLKEFDDAEFRITGVNPGRGRMADCAIFTCETSSGNSFDCKMSGSLDTLRLMLKNPKSVMGKYLTVKYQGMTNGNVPRFPIGISVRDYE